MMNCSAVLIDTISIQDYIFSSNRLKENLGASYIIEHKIFKEELQNVLEKINDNGQVDIDQWKKNPDHVGIINGEKTEVGYVGGGKAFILFKEQEKAKFFIKEYSLALLIKYPGIQPAFALKTDFECDEENFKSSFQRLNNELNRKKKRDHFQVTPLKPGIVQDCPRSNEAKEISAKQHGEIDRVSMLTAAKLDCNPEAKRQLEHEHREALGEKFQFTYQLDQLGQKEDKGYIGVVHIDGNSMGRLFMECSDLSQIRKLSSQVDAKSREAMKALIEHVVGLFDGNGCLNGSEEFKLHYENQNDTGKFHLPIRPVITAGDDTTFVCEGRLAIYLAEKFIEFLTQKPLQLDWRPEGEKEHTLHACAGIAIVKTKYPFFKAYQLAEELTDNAKKPSRKEHGSYLDYLVASSGFSGDLETIRDKAYRIGENKYLNNTPYLVKGDQPTIQELKKGIRDFNQWPRSKAKELRDVLRKDKASQDYFLTHIRQREEKLPDPQEELWKEIGATNTAPHYDMIELMDFYPEPLLKENTDE